MVLHAYRSIGHTPILRWEGLKTQPSTAHAEALVEISHAIYQTTRMYLCLRHIELERTAPARTAVSEEESLIFCRTKTAPAIGREGHFALQHISATECSVNPASCLSSHSPETQIPARRASGHTDFSSAG